MTTPHNLRLTGILYRQISERWNGSHGGSGECFISMKLSHELRMKFGPGYRVYFINRNNRLILLLCGGDKSSQSRDIALAKSMAKDDLDGTENKSV